MYIYKYILNINNNLQNNCYTAYIILSQQTYNFALLFVSRSSALVSSVKYKQQPSSASVAAVCVYSSK